MQIKDALREFVDDSRYGAKLNITLSDHRGNACTIRIPLT